MKILNNKIVVPIFFLALLSPVVYLYYRKPDISFWDNFFTGLISTVLALVAGIPIALWIDRFIKRQEEKKRYNQNRKRELEIIQLIKEEIEFSYKSLFLKEKKGNSKFITIQQLKSDLWEALAKSQELKHIENPKLLNRIASAYYILNLVKNIEGQAYIALRTSAIVFKTEDGKEEGAAQQLLKDARQLDSLFEKSCEEALKMIDVRIDKLEKI